MREFRSDQLDAALDDLLGADDSVDSIDSELIELPGYEIGELLGEGASGVVVRAIQERTGSAVAIKLFKSHPWDSGRDERFRREVAALATLQHEGFPRIIDCGEQSGVSYIVQEYIEGERLDAFVERQELDEDSILRLIAKVAAIVGRAHQAGLVHRDLKPGNIIVRRDGQPVVVDFGIVTGDAPGLRHEQTVTGGVLGTPAYMAPEQARGESATPSSDVYSLAVLALALLPRGASKSSSRLRSSPSRRLNESSPWRTVLRRGSAADPAERHPDATAFAKDLNSALELTTRRSKRRLLLAGAASLAAATVLVAFGVMTAGSNGEWILIEDDNGAPGDQFGTSISLHESGVITGAPRDEPPARKSTTDHGAIVVHKRDPSHDFDQLQRNTPFNSLAPEDHGPEFGRASSVDGDLLAVGAPGLDTPWINGGAVWIYEFNGSSWNPLVMVLPEDAADNDYFGAAVCLRDGLLFVGAHLADAPEPQSGKVYVFERRGDEWLQTGVITPEESHTEDWFGISLAYSNGRLFVGAPRRDAGDITNRGTVFVFERGGGEAEWEQVASIEPQGEHAQTRHLCFGRQIEASGDLVVVSGGSGNGRGVNSEACAFVYRKQEGQYIEEAKLAPSEPLIGDSRGVGLAIHEGAVWMSVIARTELDQMNSIHRFEYTANDWTETLRLDPPTKRTDTNLGFPLRVDDRGVFIGEPDHSGRTAGRVWFWPFPITIN
ncbi:MAG: protein kinase [Phycisphaerales bacterium]